MIDPIRDDAPERALRSAPTPPRRLQKLLQRAAPLRVLRAPYGFETSYLVRWWAESGGADVTGVCVTPGHGWDSTRMWQKIAEMLVTVGVIDQSQTVGDRTSADDVRRVLMHIRRPLRLAIPHLDRVDGGRIDDQILRVVDVCPRVDVTVSVSGRRLFKLPGALDPTHDLIDSEILRHTIDDMHELVDEAGVELRPGELKVLYAATGGLPELSCIALRVAADLPELPRRHGILEVRIREAVARRVEESVLAMPVARAHQAFLTRTAAAHFLTREIASFLDTKSDAGQCLETLENAGVLGYCDTEQGDTWSLPPAVRQVLLGRHHTVGMNPYARMTALAHYHLARKEYGQALRYATEAQQAALSAAIINDHGAALIGTHLGPLIEALRALPDSILASHPQTRAAHELVALLVQGPRPHVDRVPAGPSTPRTTSELHLATYDTIVLRISGAYEDAYTRTVRLSHAASTLVASSPPAHTSLFPFLRMQWALTFQLAGDFPMALAELGVAYRLGAAGDLDYIARNAAGNVALAWALAGERARVREWLALEESHPTNDAWADALTGVGGLVARTLTALDAGDLECAGRALAQLVDPPATVELWPLLLHARCRYAIARATPESGLTALAEFEDARRRSQGGFVKSLVDASELEIRLALGDGVRAVKLARAADRSHPWDTVAAARAHLLTGDPDGAIRVVRRYEWLGGPYIRFHVDALLIEAIALHQTGQTTASHRAWVRAFDLASRIGYSSLLAGVPRASAIALAAATETELSAGQLHPQTYPSDISFPNLTDRESAVLRGIEQGLTGDEIADALLLSIHTVKSHRRTLYRKLGVRTRSGAVETARSLGILDDGNGLPTDSNPPVGLHTARADPDARPAQVLPPETGTRLTTRAGTTASNQMDRAIG